MTRTNFSPFRPGTLRTLFLAGLLSLATGAVAAEEVVVYKSPTCGCCTKWVDHLRANGFEVTAHDVADMNAVKQRVGLPHGLGSCHTAQVGGYVIEGHVPAADIRRLLDERPAVAVLAAPGMPMGSPGMEGPYREPYDVVAFDGKGGSRVFAHHE